MQQTVVTEGKFIFVFVCVQVFILKLNKYETVEVNGKEIRVNGALVHVSPSHGYASAHGWFERTPVRHTLTHH